MTNYENNLFDLYGNSLLGGMLFSITKRFHAIDTFCYVSPVRFPEGTCAIGFWTAMAGCLARLARFGGRIVSGVYWSMLLKGIALCFKLRPQKIRRTDGFWAGLFLDGGELAESPSPIRVNAREMSRSNTGRCDVEGRTTKPLRRNSTMIASAGCSSKRNACNPSHAQAVKNHT